MNAPYTGCYFSQPPPPILATLVITCLEDAIPNVTDLIDNYECDRNPTYVIDTDVTIKFTEQVPDDTIVRQITSELQRIGGVIDVYFKLFQEE